MFSIYIYIYDIITSLLHLLNFIVYSTVAYCLLNIVSLLLFATFFVYPFYVMSLYFHQIWLTGKGQLLADQHQVRVRSAATGSRNS